LCIAIVGTGIVRPADMLGFGVSGAHFGECYIITTLWFEM